MLPEPSSVKFRNTIEAGPRGSDSRVSTKSNPPTQRDPLLPKPHQVYKYDLVHPHPDDYNSHRLFSGLSSSPNTRPRRYPYPTEEAKRGAQTLETILCDGRERDQDKFTR